MSRRSGWESVGVRSPKGEGSGDRVTAAGVGVVVVEVEEEVKEIE